MANIYGPVSPHEETEEGLVKNIELLGEMMLAAQARGFKNEEARLEDQLRDLTARLVAVRAGKVP